MSMFVSESLGQVIADLIDPLLSKEDANRIFRVVLSMFRRAQTDCGKLVVFDEVCMLIPFRLLHLVLVGCTGSQVFGHASGRSVQRCC